MFIRQIYTKYRKPWILALCWLITQPLFAQQEEVFRNLDMKEGLSQGTVFTITQDELGHMWLGTRDGLNKYDGYQFTVYRHDPQESTSVVGNDIRVLYFDTTQHTLWIGTLQGLSRYDAAVDTFHNYRESEGLSSNSIRCIQRDSKGRLWVGTADGLNLLQEDGQKFRSIPLDFPANIDGEIIAITEDSRGSLLIGVDNGLYELIEQGADRFSVRPLVTKDQFSLSDYRVQAILEGEPGQLWIGTRSGGVYLWDRPSNDIKVFQNEGGSSNALGSSGVRVLAKESNGMIWIGTFVGLIRYNPKTEEYHHFFADDQNPIHLRSRSIRSIFFDQRGGLWIGTYHGGASYYDPALSRFRHFEHLARGNSISHNVVSSFLEDEKGNFWIGTEGGGLNYFNRTKGRFTTYRFRPEQTDGISGNNVKTIIKDGPGLWIGTFRQGLNYLDLTTKTFRHFKHDPEATNSLTNNNVYSLLKEDNLLWIVTYGGGLNVLDFNTNKFKAYQADPFDSLSISSNNGRVIFKDSRDQLWVGTEDGLNLMKRSSIQDTSLQFQCFIADKKIYALYEDERQTLWIGTFSNGLFALNLDNLSIQQYTEVDGLPGRAIFGIEQDEMGKLWLSTNNGLSKLDRDNAVFTNYNYSNGLQNLQFNYNAHYRTASGELLFGGYNGFTLFEPAEIISDSFTPPLIFTDLRVYNEKVDVGDKNGLLPKALNEVDELTFKYNEAIFSIGVAALDYFNPSNVQYAYKLEGLDNDWNHKVGLTEASYTIQRPGNYLLRVKASNGYGIWSEEERHMKIKVLPPPWLSPIAYVIYSITFGLIIYGIWYFTRLRHRLRLEQLAKAKEKELNEVKLRFYTDITHEFRTPLTLILGPINELIDQHSSSGSSSPLYSVKRNAERLLKLVNQILSFRKLESGHENVEAQQADMVPFLQEIYSSFEETAKLRKIHYAFHASVPEVVAWFDPEKLEKVVFNLLSNAFKFTPDQGEIKLEIDKKANTLLIRVSDSGNGIKEELHEQIFKRYYEKVAIPFSKWKGSGLGLALSKQMITLHHGKLWVESEVGQGATFFVEIPLGKEHFKQEELVDGQIALLPLSPTIQENIALTPKKESSTSPSGSSHPEDEAPAILLVEDNIEILQYLEEVFQGTYRIATAADGREGLRKAAELNPDLIISDIMMPNMDGNTLCQKIKANIKTSHIPVILLTARAAQPFKNEGLETGADDYITKPFNPSELRLRVRNIIRTRKIIREKFVRVMNFEPKEVTVTSADEQFLRNALDIAEKHIEDSNFTAEQFAYELAVSRPLLFTKMKALTDQTPNNFMKTLRMKRAAQLLGQRKLNVSEVAYKVGFRDTRYFSKCFQKQFNKTPSEYMSDA
ncbi:MAG: response regulator [Saprospiraceae bacterium]|nr:response regulator [Saprospiraceae bacterium]